MTPTTLEPVRDVAHLNALIAGSAERPLLLYKHSRSCGTSHEALDELQAHLAEAPRDATYAIVTVQGQRDLSDAIAKRFQLRHETPQALLVRDGQLVWSASHFRVTADAVARAIDEASTAALTR
ncbi:MAG: bacillithiol system redox-active protein YtxJ [Vicinamibacterales bacterium]